MADVFKFIGGLPSERKEKVYNLAGKTKDEAMKYLRYLNRNAMFGTHTGLPQEIRNTKMNESLVSNIGDYSVLDVFSTSGNSCEIGTVVNFYTSDPNNTLGATYVYPCTDKNKPMGYMISKAEPDKLGVCLVHGVLEVPLAYPKGSEELERGNYVEYDIEDACFRFADSGYPVFNVYQDVDGDWIAIILFGDIASEYDGPFAVSVAGITGSTMYVNSLGGSVLYNDVNGECADLEISVPLSTGESLWLETTIVGDTCSYQFMPLSTIPVDGNTTFYTKLAENNEGKLRQIHYGNIRYSRTKIISGSTNVHIYPSNGLGDVVISVDSTPIPPDRFFVPDYDSLQIIADTIPDGLGHTFILPVNAGTVCMWDEGGGAKAVYTDIDGAISITLNNKEVATVPYDGWVRVSVIDGGTASNECLSLDTSTGHIELYKYGTFCDKNIEYKEGVGISITDETISSTNEEVEGEIVPVEVLTGNKIISLDADLTATLENDVVSISITGSTSPVKLIKGSGIIFTDGSSENEIIIGATFTQNIQDLTLDVDDDTATIGLTESSSQVSITGGTNISIIAGDDGEFVINCTVVGNTGSVTGITSTVGVNDATVSLFGGSGSVVFVGEGLTTISTNENNEIIVGSTFTETLQDLTVSLNEGGTATIGLTYSSSQVNFEGMGSVYLTQIRSSADITERESWGRRYNPDTGEEDGELKNAGWRGIIPLKIFDDSVPDDMVMTEISMYDAMEVDGSTVNVLYPLIVPDTTDEELGIIARCTLNELAYPSEILEKAYDWAETRVNQGKSPFYDGDASDESLRNIPNSDTIIVYGVVPSLMSHVVDDNVAVLEIAGSTSYVLVEAGDGLFLTAGQDANSFVFNSLITIEIDGSTGGGGGEPALTLLTPNYSSLAITGGTVPEGLGHTFVLPVKAGTVGFFDDGLGAVGVWTDVTGASIERLTNRTVYDAPCDGWIRVSVIDAGTSSGSCLSIQDVTGNLPIYKYGSFASLSVYNGPFKVTRVPDANVNDFDTTFDVFISDGLGRDQNYAGYVIDGESTRIPIDASNVVSHSGDEIYLIQSGGTYSFVSVSSYSALPSCDFATLISKMTTVTSGGSVLFSEPIQIQRADIVAPPRQISCSVYSDNYALIELTGSTSSVKLIKGNGILLSEGSNANEIVLGATFTEIPQDLNVGVSYGVASISITGGYNTVKLVEGTNITITEGADGEVVIGSTFTEIPQDLSSFVGNTGTATVSLSGSTNTIKIIQGDNITITAGEGDNEIILGSTVTGTVTGLTSSVNTNSATVSTVGGVGDVVFVGEGLTTVSTNSSNAIVLSTSYTETPQNLTLDIDNYVATIGISDSSSTINITGGTNILVREGDGGGIVIDCTVVGNTGSVTGLTHSVNTNSATVSTVGGFGDVVFVGSGLTTVSQNGNNEIVFGTTASSSYDGPFAIKVDHADSETPTTLYIYRNGGVVSFEHEQKNIASLSPLNVTALASGESYWLRYDVANNTTALYVDSSPIYSSSTQINVELARNENGVLKQIQYGNIELSKPKLTHTISSGSAFLGITGSTSTIKITGKNGVVLSNDNGNIALSVNSSVVASGITSSISGNTAIISSVGGSGEVNFIGVGGTTVAQGISDTILIDSIIYKEGTGISIDDEIDSDTNLLTGDKIISLDADLSSSLTNPNEASVYITGSTAPVKFKAGEGIVVSAGQNSNEVVISSVITIDVDGSGGGGSGGLDTLSVSVANGTASIYITGTTEYVKLIKGSGVTITEGANSNEVVIGSTVSGNTGTVTGVSYSVGLNNTATISTIGGSGKVKFVGDGVNITETSSNEIKLAVTGGTSGGGSYSKQFILEQSAVDKTVPGEVTQPILIQPNTNVFIALEHDLNGTPGNYVYRYWWSGSSTIVKHVTADDPDAYSTGEGYGAELKLVTPTENSTVIIYGFADSAYLLYTSDNIPLITYDGGSEVNFVYLGQGMVSCVYVKDVGTSGIWYCYANN